nr:immunoglobulin heavy chain junction region [Macaca mulatta]
CAKKEDDFDCW